MTTSTATTTVPYAELAQAHGSLALLRRCEHDLRARGVRLSAPGVLPTA